MLNRTQTGFTLIEIAIVLLIVSILLGYTVALFPRQQELKQYRAVDREMDEIIASLIGFAQINGRLPCPDTSGGVGNVPGTVNGVLDGIEDTADNVVNNPVAGTNPFGVDGDGADDNIFDGEIDGCLAYSGFVPARTLGINGDFNATGQLLDPWGGAYGYFISDIDVDANGDGDDGDGDIGIGDDLVTPNGIRDEGLTNVDPDLFICDDSTELGLDLNCDDVTGNQVIANVAVVIISLGKSYELGAGSTNIQRENFDNFNDGTLDKVYISTTRSDVAGAQFDDVVKWISTTSLFSKMIEADQLP